ncbi:uncharacterized protein LOC116141082 [Pistacia vera]|uniref:uncharacterized protein LOC116141082 n=1 Tax=Pistacia vera TaxID=55513 RepID=UPI001262DDD4|nr:uncharacterized protein LOC116141082 [Pistacia vera]
MASNLAPLSPPIFNGDQYHVWAVKMKTYLRGHGLWQDVEEEKQVPQLRPNPTLIQMRIHEEEEEFGGSSQTRNMQVLNLRREFEALKIQEAEFVKEYVDKLMVVVNKIKLLGEELTNKRIVEKVLVSLPERFEAKISSLEDFKDLSQISLSELVHPLQA